MTTLQSDLTSWQNELAALDEDCAAEGWTEPEKLLLTLQRTSGAYRWRVLPHVETDQVRRLPALSADDAREALSAYNLIIVDELAGLVSQLDELRLELIRFGQTEDLQLRATTILASLRTLSRLLLRLSQETPSQRPKTQRRS